MIRENQTFSKANNIFHAYRKKFIRWKIALDKRFLLVKVSSKSPVEYGGNAKGLKENFPFCGIRQNSKLQNLVKLDRKEILGCPRSSGPVRESGS